MTVELEHMIPFPQDRIILNGHHVGYVCHHKGAPINLIKRGISESELIEIKAAVAERECDGDAEQAALAYDRRVSQVPDIGEANVDE